MLVFGVLAITKSCLIRSSIALRLNSIAQVGGVNSIENFARSWTRAAAFQEITPHRPSFIFGDQDDETAVEYTRTESPGGRLPPPRTSLLRQHLEASYSDNAVEDEDDLETPRPLGPRESDNKQLGAPDNMSAFGGSMRSNGRGRDSIFAIAPHLATPLVGSYGTSYGTLQSNLTDNSMQHAGQLWKQQQAAQARGGDGEHAPLLIKEVERDGKVVLVVEGQSTVYQTIFNSTNVLIGVGLLSLPMGIKYAGWICGMIFLALSALVTAYTARLLAKCMDVDAGLITFADLALVSYGPKARAWVSVLFTMELVAACVALVVLFADTLDLLLPGYGVNQWKILCAIILLPLQFLPMQMLSFTSVIGIVSCFSIVAILFIDGFTKPNTPGSLREPAPTYLFPNNWLTLPLSFGLLMSPWGGHSVFPNIYRDMRHPYKFPKAIKVTFTFTYFLDCATAVAGLLMFGDNVRDEITANIFEQKGYPQFLSIALCIFIAIIPLTKLPLNARPIVSTIEHFCGLKDTSISDTPSLTGLSSASRGILKIVVRLLVIVIIVCVAVVFPAFDSIMAFMGSSLCFSICVILPLLFYLKIFGKEISMRERVLDWFLIVVCSILASVGTVWAFLPKSMIGAK